MDIFATSLKIGAIILQGPHQGAQNQQLLEFRIYNKQWSKFDSF